MLAPQGVYKSQFKLHLTDLSVTRATAPKKLKAVA